MKDRYCQYCGEPFSPESPAQRTCKKLACQRRQHADRMARYLQKKRQKDNI